MSYTNRAPLRRAASRTMGNATSALALKTSASGAATAAASAHGPTRR